MEREGEDRIQPRPSVLSPPARDAPGARSDAAATTVVLICVALGAVILVLLALALQDWVEQRRKTAMATKPHTEAAAPPPTTRSPSNESAAPRTPPSPDPGLANAKLRGNPALAFGADNYPVEAIRRDEQGRTVARLSIDATGTPVACEVTTSSGSAILDRTTCRIALARVRFEPARDARGVATASSYTLPVRWVLPQIAEPSPNEERRDGGSDGIPLWTSLLLAGFAGYEGFALRKGLRSGMMPAPRAGKPADRAHSPALFAFYGVIHALMALIFGGGAIFGLLSLAGWA